MESHVDFLWRFCWPCWIYMQALYTAIVVYSGCGLSFQKRDKDQKALSVTQIWIVDGKNKTRQQNKDSWFNSLLPRRTTHFTMTHASVLVLGVNVFIISAF